MEGQIVCMFSRGDENFNWKEYRNRCDCYMAREWRSCFKQNI